MKSYLKKSRERIHKTIYVLHEFLIFVKDLLKKQFNKNIYTRILFTNVAIFIAGLIVLIMFSSFGLKQVTSDQIQQELLRKAKRVNFALLKQREQPGWPLSAEEMGEKAQDEQN